MSEKISRIWCMDSPGFGGAELALMRVLKMTGFAGACVLHANQIDPKLVQFFCTNGLEAQAVFPGGNKLRSALSGLRNAFRQISRFRDGNFIVWCHHLDSNRWLQLALGLSRARYILVERLIPASKDALASSRLTIPIKRWVVQRASAVVLNGFSQQEIYTRMFGPPREKLWVIPNSRPVVQMAARATELRLSRDELRRKLNLPDGPIAVCVGRLCGQKDQASLIQAMDQMDRRDGLAPTLVLVGEGEAENELRELAAKVSRGSVIFAGFQTDPLPWLAAADLFVLASLAEGLPGALLEAMSASLPCVATDIPGNRELVRNEETGLLVPIKEPKALARALERLLGDTALARRLAFAGHDLVTREYDESVEKAGWVKMLSTLPSPDFL